MKFKSTFRLLATSSLCALLVGCGSDTGRFGEASITNPFGNSARFSDPKTTASLTPTSQAEPVPATDIVMQQSQPVTRDTISSAPLAPPAAAQPGNALPPLTASKTITSQPQQKVASLTAPTTPVTTPPATAASQAGTAGKWSAQGGSTVTLAANETLTTLANRYGVPESAIRSVNGLTAKAKPAVGTKLIVPVYAADAAVPAKSQPVATATPAVAPAPVLTKKEAAKAAADAAKASAPAAVAAAPATAGSQKPTQVASLDPKAATKTVVEANSAESADASTSKTIAAAGFRWPARGRVIQAFGDKNGVKSTGINISLPQGTPVKAAETGVVAYAGSEVKGYGNLVMIRHPDGWVSVYACNSEIKVKRGDQIKRGQVVALSGQSGDVSSPQLHFELRKGSTPVDPVEHLADD